MISLLVGVIAVTMLLTGTVAAQLLDELPPDICQEKDTRTAVLLIGSYHMSNPGLDQFNLKSDDVRVPKRQKELEALSKRLASFKPTKVAVEAPFGDEPTVAAYKEYVAGKREMRRSEEEQIGFRLAKKMGHDAIYPIDVRMSLSDKELRPIIGSNPEYQKKMGELNRLGNAAIDQMGKWLAEGSVSYMLYQMNRPVALRQAHWPYIWIFATIAKDDNYAGADFVARWYNRNLRIFANLDRISEKGDRVVVVYGMGHIPILKDLVVSSPDYCTVDPLPFLDESKDSAKRQ